MKRLVIIAMLLLCSGVTAWAQRPERNLIGMPVYYDTLGNIIGQDAPKDSLYHRPKHHFHNRLENEFCSVFLEGQTRLERNMSLGAQMAWVPQRWGIYGSGCISRDRCNFSVGPVLRLSDCGDWIDWQLYGGLSSSFLALGAEMGVRVASPKLWGDFCWTSFSLTVGHIHETNYVALGFSLTLTSFVAITIW